MVQQVRQGLAPALLPVFGKYRHEGLGKGPFREQPAQKVGDAEGNEEGVGRPGRPETYGQHHVPQKAEQARDERHAADHGGGLQKPALQGSGTWLVTSGKEDPDFTGFYVPVATSLKGEG